MRIVKNTQSDLVIEDSLWATVFTSLVTGVIVFMFTRAAFAIKGDAPNPFEYFFFGVFLICALAMHVFLHDAMRRTRWAFSRDKRTLTIRIRTIFRRRIYIHDLSDVQSAVIQETDSSEESEEPLLRVVVKITGLKSGFRPLTSAYGGGLDHRGIAKSINDWLAVYKRSTP